MKVLIKQHGPRRLGAARSLLKSSSPSRHSRSWSHLSVQSSTPRLRLVLLATRAPIALCTVTAMAAAAARPHVIRRALALGAELVVESGGDFASSSSK